MSILHTQSVGGELKIAILGVVTWHTVSANSVSYNVSGYPGFENFTVDNFATELNALWISSGGSVVGTGNFSKSYNPVTGIYTVSLSTTCGNGYYLRSLPVTTRLFYVD